VGEKELEELFWRSTDGPSEGGQAASATEKATVQVQWGHVRHVHAPVVSYIHQGCYITRERPLGPLL
jgi:hypothetical protein